MRYASPDAKIAHATPSDGWNHRTERMSRDRIKETFDAIAQQGRPGLIVFITAGHPDREATLELVPALVEAGADAVEIGIPFSDPLAEGPVIQESSFLAVQQQVSLQECLGMVAQLRDIVPDTPLILMGYYNPIYNYGLSRFAHEAQQAGVDALIPVDLPHAEVRPLARECADHSVHIIYLLAPTSTDESIEAVCTDAGGFIYLVSLTGVTGAREQVSERGFDLLDRVRSHTDLPLAVGFGISNRQHVERVCEQAEAAIVGSALVRVMLESPRDELVERASRLVSELAGKSIAAVGESA